MNDDPLLRTLAAADTPPPPGVPLSPATLRARAAARTRRAVVVAAGIALLLAPLGARLAQHLTSASQDDDRRAWTAPTDVVLDELADELRALGARLARLRATLASPAPPIAAVAVTPAARLNVRTALAEARAAALSDHRPVETRR